MKRFSFLFCAAALAALTLSGGCALLESNVTTTKISKTTDGGVQIESGKDVKFGKLTWHETLGSNAIVDVEVSDYDARTNVEAIKAQRGGEVDAINATVNAVQAGINAAGQLAGKAAGGVVTGGLKP